MNTFMNIFIHKLLMIELLLILILLFQNLVCCASDVLEGGRGIVRVAVTVAELLRFHQTRSPMHNASVTSVSHSFA